MLAPLEGSAAAAPLSGGFRVVYSYSMAPVLVPGDLIRLAPLEAGGPAVGSVVAYTQGSHWVAHRVTHRAGRGDAERVTVCADANGRLEHIPRALVSGRVVARLRRGRWTPLGEGRAVACQARLMGAGWRLSRLGRAAAISAFEQLQRAPRLRRALRAATRAHLRCSFLDLDGVSPLLGNPWVADLVVPTRASHGSRLGICWGICSIGPLVVGRCMLRHDPDLAAFPGWWVTDGSVRRPYRRLGAVRAMLEGAIEACLINGWSPAFTSVNVDNHAMLPLMGKVRGLRLLGETTRPTGERDLVYQIA